MIMVAVHLDINGITNDVEGIGRFALNIPNIHLWISVVHYDKKGFYFDNYF